jgi:hypothetical protein
LQAHTQYSCVEGERLANIDGTVIAASKSVSTCLQRRKDIF